MPIYSWSQLAWNAALLGLTYLLLHRLGAAFAPWGVLSGAGGALAVQYSTRPAAMTLNGRGKSDITLLLERSGWRYEAETQCWTPDLPTWLRWDYNRVELASDSAGLRVTGPTNVLRRIRALMASNARV